MPKLSKIDREIYRGRKGVRRSPGLPAKQKAAFLEKVQAQVEARPEPFTTLEEKKEALRQRLRRRMRLISEERGRKIHVVCSDYKATKHDKLVGCRFSVVEKVKKTSTPVLSVTHHANRILKKQVSNLASGIIGNTLKILAEREG